MLTFYIRQPIRSQCSPYFMQSPLYCTQLPLPAQLFFYDLPLSQGRSSPPISPAAVVAPVYCYLCQLQVFGHPHLLYGTHLSGSVMPSSCSSPVIRPLASRVRVTMRACTARGSGASMGQSCKEQPMEAASWESQRWGVLEGKDTAGWGLRLHSPSASLEEE